MATEHEVNAMRLAIAVSARGLGTTSPNPPVGCVILDAHGDTVGIGYHERKGEAHAEGRALAQAGTRARGGTAVVTLEPCNHVGRTPACRQLLLDAGIVRVVVALIDPTSQGDGGIAVLRKAGVRVEAGVLADEARLVLGPWLASFHTGLPIVTMAYQMDQAGFQLVERTADAQLRSSFDVVLSDGGHIVEAVPASHGQGILALPSGPFTGEPTSLLSRLFKSGVRTVLLMGSREFMWRFVDADTVDRIVVVMSGTAHPDALTPAVPHGFKMERIAKVGQDIWIESVRAKGPDSR